MRPKASQPWNLLNLGAITNNMTTSWVGANISLKLFDQLHKNAAGYLVDWKANQRSSGIGTNIIAVQHCQTKFCPFPTATSSTKNLRMSSHALKVKLNVYVQSWQRVEQVLVVQEEVKTARGLMVTYYDETRLKNIYKAQGYTKVNYNSWKWERWAIFGWGSRYTTDYSTFTNTWVSKATARVLSMTQVEHQTTASRINTLKAFWLSLIPTVNRYNRPPLRAAIFAKAFVQNVVIHETLTH